MNETWKAVPGYEGLYEVSDLGRVKRLESVVRFGRVGSRQKRLPERIIPPTTVDRGYLRVNLWRDNRCQQFQVHRLVMFVFRGKSELSVDHLNGVTSDNRLANLEYCSLDENTRRQHAKGRVTIVRGEDNGKAKLDADKVRFIRSMLSGGASSRAVAEQIGVSKGTVQAVRERRTWSHVV